MLFEFYLDQRLWKEGITCWSLLYWLNKKSHQCLTSLIWTKYDGALSETKKYHQIFEKSFVCKALGKALFVALRGFKLASSRFTSASRRFKRFKLICWAYLRKAFKSSLSCENFLPPQLPKIMKFEYFWSSKLLCLY